MALTEQCCVCQKHLLGTHAPLHFSMYITDWLYAYIQAHRNRTFSSSFPAFVCATRRLYKPLPSGGYPVYPVYRQVSAYKWVVECVNSVSLIYPICTLVHMYNICVCLYTSLDVCKVLDGSKCICNLPRIGLCSIKVRLFICFFGFTHCCCCRYRCSFFLHSLTHACHWLIL